VGGAVGRTEATMVGGAVGFGSTGAGVVPPPQATSRKAAADTIMGVANNFI